MSDSEKLNGGLSVEVATSLEQRAYGKGYAAGKSRARLEALAVVVVLYFGIALYGRMAGA